MWEYVFQKKTKSFFGAAAVAHTLGSPAGPQGELQHGFSAASLAVITAWLGSNYMSGRLQLKAGPALQTALQEAFARRLNETANGIEDRVNQGIANYLHAPIPDREKQPGPMPDVAADPPPPNSAPPAAAEKSP